MGDLRLVRVETRAFEEALPESAVLAELIDDITQATSGIGIIPTAVRREIGPELENSVTERVLPHNFAKDYHLSYIDTLAELAQPRKILAYAKRCMQEDQSEAAWNARVHDRVLIHALEGTCTKPWIT